MLKKIVSIMLILVMCFSFAACGDDRTLCREINDERVCKTYRQWGIADWHVYKEADVEYDVVVGNVIWGVLLFGTVVAPIMLFGWYLYEPVDWKSNVYTVNSSSLRQDKIKR